MKKISKKSVKPKSKAVKTDPRIDKMVQSWKESGRAFSHLGKDDKAFFKKIRKSPMEVGVTSQTGGDLVYYNTKIFGSDSDALKMRKISKK